VTVSSQGQTLKQNCNNVEALDRDVGDVGIVGTASRRSAFDA